ncbi:hypothetical protein K439DRAFT_1407576 [Ramaria rubella]|nr:hypothetical protein K439DRAFT_1407576 [Ramaria rubella]
MEERGVLVAIAGRRDGVRVYALEEIRKAIEWRMDAEMRRELDRMRREDAKRATSGSVDNIFRPVSTSGSFKSGGAFPRPPSASGLNRKASLPISTPSTAHSTPKPPTTPRRKAQAQAQLLPRPSSPPPEYEDPSPSSRPRPRSTTSGISVDRGPSHRASVSTIVGMPNSVRRRSSAVHDSRNKNAAEKSDALSSAWAGSSDDEAISLVAAGPSGSAALDERTSNTASASRRQSSAVGQLPTTATPLIPPIPPNPPAIIRSRRPSNLDLSAPIVAQPSNPVPSSPTPTLSTLRQTLSRSPPLAARGPTVMDTEQPSEGEADGEGDGDLATTPTGERISFAQALLESRLPNLPPPGTRQPQRPVFISASHPVVTGEEDSVPASGDEGRPGTSSSFHHRTSVAPKTPNRKSDHSKRRRWTVLDGMFNNNAHATSEPPQDPMPSPVDHRHAPLTAGPAPSRTSVRAPSPTSVARSQSVRSGPIRSGPSSAPSQTLSHPPSEANSATPNLPQDPERNHGLPSPRTSTSSGRFLPRIISNALNTRRSEESGLANSGRGEADGAGRRAGGNSLYPQAAAPKLEYVKLPGTKGAIMIKTVETAKKSFLAILCGEAGEKVELFAGTYRTALGLSRTFILPDSPRNLELQLQGDDLVEVFLVFSHNVFGLEPATVRVREVRIGRAERRAARRRAREARTGETEPADGEPSAPGEEDTNVVVGIGVTLPSTPDVNGLETPTSARHQVPRQTSDSTDIPSSPAEPAIPTSSVTNPDDLMALAASQIGAYTTFQQLSFAPNFPLATLADECIIPPTYPSAAMSRRPPTLQDNGDSAHSSDLSTQQVLSPPGLPVPPSLPPSKWYYKDPKGVVQGPWKASLMQSWYKDGYLPLDLPVRREIDTEYVLLQDLRLQSVDPNHPFRPAPLPLARTPLTDDAIQPAGQTKDIDEPLLQPISLLAQPRHYGPPALFFSSRGGHSTAIVDARGRSVLKGRFFWSIDDEPDAHPVINGKLGDIKRVEAFDVRDRAIIVALRQGGLEAVDIGDALLAPADESRTVLPDYQVPVGSVSRRGTYIWRIGAPVSMPPVSSTRDPANTALSLVRKRHPSAMNSLGRAPGRSETPLGFDDGGDANLNEEVLFLGRNDDNVYFCERTAASFRILRLAPSY